MRQSADVIVPFLGPIFWAMDKLRWYPSDWKVTHTPVIRKPAKADYALPRAWHPVVLSDGLARLLNRCKTEYLTEQCERTGVLPSTHFGGRKRRSTVDSIHWLVSAVKAAWRKGQVASVLFLNVKGAFPSVAIDRLVHELRAAGVPNEHGEWMIRRLEGRRTILTFDDFKSQAFDIDGGLDQGDPRSGISYMIYNAGLLRCLNAAAGESGGLFIDDAYLLAIGNSMEETHGTLKSIMERPEGVFEWAEAHNCEFGVDKFQLIDFTRRREPDPTHIGKTRSIMRPDITLRG
jgi:hypothetical protein